MIETALLLSTLLISDGCFVHHLPAASDHREAPDAVLLLAGQSNLFGVGVTAQQPHRAPIEPVVVWAHDHWATYQPDIRTFGPHLMFALLWAKDHPTKKVGLIIVTSGSTISAWHPGGHDEDRPMCGSPWEALWQTYAQAGSLPIRGMFWMQGEADTGGGVAWRYEAQFPHFVREIQALIGPAPFIFGYTVTPNPDTARIHTAQVAVSRWPGVVAIQTADLARPDGTHLTTQGYLTLGRRFYKAWTQQGHQ